MKHVRGFAALTLCIGIIIFSAVVVMAVGGVTYTGPTITFRLSSHIPSTNKIFKDTMAPWVEHLSKTSNNKIKIKFYMGGVLNGPKDGFKACVANIADIAHGYPQYAPGSFRLCHALELPFAFPNAYVASLVAEELYVKYFKKEYENMGVYLASYNSTPVYNILSKKPIRRLEDVKGLKIRSAGGLAMDIVKKLGGVPVFIPTAEVYSAFQRGIVDAVLLHDVGILAYRLYEVGKYKTKVGLNLVGTPFCLNRKKFDRLPADLKRVFYNNLRLLSQFSAHGYMSGDEHARKVMKREGVEVITLSRDEFSRWKTAVKPIWDEFVSKNEAAGLPARRLIKDMMALNAKYENWTPKRIMERVKQQPARGIIDGM
jgi:TRAP-type C4-dicarboxylate transport system substrate-binding protein